MNEFIPSWKVILLCVEFFGLGLSVKSEEMASNIGYVLVFVAGAILIASAM